MTPTKKPKHIKFAGYTCNIKKSSYRNNRTALILTSKTNNKKKDLLKGDAVAIATINVKEIDLPYDQVIIKNYAENEGILLPLQNAGIVGPVITTTQFGPICKLLI